MKRFPNDFWQFLIVVVLFSVSILFNIKLPVSGEVVMELPNSLVIQEYDIADYGGEMGKLYVVRAEWVYLSRESAEEKKGDLCKFTTVWEKRK